MSRLILQLTMTALILSSTRHLAVAATTDTARQLFAQAFEQMKLDNVDLAIALFRRGLEADPKDAHANLLLGQLLEGKGDRAGATAAYTAALDASPRSSVDNVNAEVALSRLRTAAVPDEARAPIWRLGYSWTSRNEVDGKESYIKNVVTNIEADEAIVSYSYSDGKTTDNAKSYIKFNDGFPLHVGKKWEPESGSLFSGRNPCEAEVLRSEQIATAMGTYFTYVVRTRTTDPADKYALTIVRWYSPKLGLNVKEISKLSKREIISVSGLD